MVGNVCVRIRNENLEENGHEIPTRGNYYTHKEIV